VRRDILEISCGRWISITRYKITPFSDMSLFGNFCTYSFDLCRCGRWVLYLVPMWNRQRSQRPHQILRHMLGIPMPIIVRQVTDMVSLVSGAGMYRTGQTR